MTHQKFLRNSVWTGVLALCLALPAGAATKPASIKSTETVDLVGPFKVHRFKFNNGLKLLVIEDHSSPTFAYQTWYRVGSRDEVPGRTGLAHLFEHMMFNGTKDIKEGEFDRILEKNGVEGENAFTTRDATVYIQEMPQNAGKLDLIAKLEADRMVNLVVNDKSFKTEREVVQNERRFRVENSPEGQLHRGIFELAFTKHNYRWPVIGYEKDLAEMTSKDALDFYKSFYGPTRATIVISGDVKADQAAEVVAKYYGDLPATQLVDRRSENEPIQTQPRRKTLKLSMQVEKSVMAYHIPPILHPDRPALEVLMMSLAGGKSSRLSKALVDTGLTTSIDTETGEDIDPTLFMFAYTMQKGKKATAAEKVIHKEFDKISKTLMDAKELQRAKNQLNFHFYGNLNTSFEKAYFVGLYESKAGAFEKALEFQKQIEKVTPEQVRNVAKKYLATSGYSVITGVPK